jgi:hypothetical protein
MQRKHMALGALGLAALAGLVGLWRMSQEGSPDAPGATGAATATRGRRDPGTPVEHATLRGTAGPATSAEPTTRPEVPLPGLGSPDQTALQATAQTAPGSAARDDGGVRTPRVYVRDDGVMVRDYRTRDAPPMTSGTIRRPQRGVVKVEPTTVVAVRNAMRPIVYRCKGETPEASMDAQPRIQGEVVISIAKEHLTVDDVTIQVADVQEPAASQLRECVLQDVKRITLTIPGAADVAGHTLTLPFRLRQ